MPYDGSRWFSVAEGWEFDPALRAQIDAYLEAHYEPEDDFWDEWFPFERAMRQALSAHRIGDAKVDAGALLSDSVLPAPESLEVYADHEPGDASVAAPLGGRVAASAGGAAPHPGNLEEWLAHLDEPFATTLFAIIDRKGMQDTEV